MQIYISILNVVRNYINGILGSATVKIGSYANSLAPMDDKTIGIGYEAMRYGRGEKNIAIGEISLRQVQGSNNIAMGYGSGKNVYSGANNVLLGTKSGNNIVSGNNNVAVGFESLRHNNDCWGNVAIGMCASSQTYGENNVSVGTEALRYGQYSEWNVAIGNRAGFNLRGGNNNIFIGRISQPSSSFVSNEITIGNWSHSVLRCAVTSITSLSDARDKTDISGLSYGLNFIESLSPKQFTWNQRDDFEKDENGNDTDVLNVNANKGLKDFGFIAQEVQAVDNEVLRLVYEANPEKLELSYGKLVPILVQAIKELSEKVKVLENN